MVVAAGPPGPAALLAVNERRRNVCPAPEPCPERSPDLPFPRSFVCGHCGVDVSLDAPGTSHRNHCPSCLWSRHLDRNVPGDRKADCPGGMEPIAVTIRGERRWMLIHRCTRCGRLRMNRTAADDNVLLLMQLAALPLATPPIPFLSPGAPPGSTVPGVTPNEPRQSEARSSPRRAP
jgi:DNA-directed RNA polymerase subunit RPC12/RpoP